MFISIFFISPSSKKAEALCTPTLITGDENMFDTGNTAFMLVATSLVMLMTPGLAFFMVGLWAERMSS